MADSRKLKVSFEVRDNIGKLSLKYRDVINFEGSMWHPYPGVTRTDIPVGDWEQDERLTEEEFRMIDELLDALIDAFNATEPDLIKK